MAGPHGRHVEEIERDDGKARVRERREPPCLAPAPRPVEPHEAPAARAFHQLPWRSHGIGVPRRAPRAGIEEGPEAKSGRRGEARRDFLGEPQGNGHEGDGGRGGMLLRRGGLRIRPIRRRRRRGHLAMPLRYLQEGAYGFFGSTNTAYGTAKGNEWADVLCRHFLKRVLAGASLGRAALMARHEFIGRKGLADPAQLKTLAQFCLLGDPSIHPVARKARRADAPSAGGPVTGSSWPGASGRARNCGAWARRWRPRAGNWASRTPYPTIG